MRVQEIFVSQRAQDGLRRVELCLCRLLLAQGSSSAARARLINSSNSERVYITRAYCMVAAMRETTKASPSRTTLT
jgi:hypothetical protein